MSLNWHLTSMFLRHDVFKAKYYGKGFLKQWTTTLRTDKIATCFCRRSGVGLLLLLVSDGRTRSEVVCHPCHSLHQKHPGLLWQHQWLPKALTLVGETVTRSVLNEYFKARSTKPKLRTPNSKAQNEAKTDYEELKTEDQIPKSINWASDFGHHGLDFGLWVLGFGI